MLLSVNSKILIIVTSVDIKNNLKNNEIINIVLVLKKIIVADGKITKEELNLLNKIKSALE